MNENFIIYDASGKILRTGHCPDWMVDAQAQEGEFVMLGTADQLTQYVVKGKLKLRPKMTVTVTGQTFKANGVDEGKVSGVKKGVKLRLYLPDMIECVADGSDIILTTTNPGKLEVYADCFPEQSVKVEFDAI